MFAGHWGPIEAWILYGGNMNLKSTILLGVTFIAMSVGVVETSAARGCQAICANMQKAFSTRGFLWASDQTYFRLESPLFKVEADSLAGLKRLCPNGYLVTDYERVYMGEQMTPSINIQGGYYLKNVVGYSPFACIHTVRETPTGQYPQAPPQFQPGVTQ